LPSSTYSVSDLAERYGVTPHTVLDWIHSGDLAAINVGRHRGAKKPRWRITQQALEAFENRRALMPLPGPSRQQRRRRGDVIEFY
jgi:excisionase family DNA binding protein